MFHLNIGMLIGLGLILFTVIVAGLVVRVLMVAVARGDPERQAVARAEWNRAFPIALLIAVALFAIAFVWTGIYPAQNLDQPQGAVNPGGALELKPTTGENRPEERVERRKEGTELQKEGQGKLDAFRKDFFKQENK